MNKKRETISNDFNPILTNRFDNSKINKIDEYNEKEKKVENRFSLK